MKRTYTYQFFMFAALCLLLVSCKLDKPDLNDPRNYAGGHSPVDTTGNTGGGTTDPVSDSYIPVGKGTFWKYKIVTNNVADTSTTTVTGDSTTISGKVYHTLLTSSVQYPTVQTGYVSRTGNIYTQVATAEGNQLELLELDANKDAGGTWKAPLTESGLVNGVPGQLLGTLVEKNISKTVAGKPFVNVMHAQLLVQYDYGLGDGFQTFETTDLYFAKGIGPIETDTVIDAFGSSITTIETILSYSIK